MGNERDPKEPSTPTTPETLEIAIERQGGAQVDEETVEYPRGLKLATIIAALCLAVLLVALDQTIIATAVPTITDRFHSIEDIGWQVSRVSLRLSLADLCRYGSSYLLTRAALQ